MSGASRRRGPVTPGSERIRSKPSAASYGSGGGQREMKPVEETTSESMGTNDGIYCL